MFKLYICLLLVSSSLLFCYADDSEVDDTELVMTFLIHRHGDRTPVEATLSYSNDPDTLASASAKYGYGQLTDAGRQRAYQLGQFIRRRYNDLLSPQYNKSEIYIRSTDSTRAKMTVLTAMAAVYPTTEDNWSEDINWTPVPYTTVPAEYDFNLAIVNCPTFLSGYSTLYTGTSPAMAAYSDVLEEWSTVAGVNITAIPALAYIIYDVYASQRSLGVPLEPEIEAMWSEIEEAAGVGMNILFGNEDYIALQAGVLLNEFFTVADQVIAGEDVQRVQIYSAHDVNVFSFEAVSRIMPRQGVPKYASAFSLELRKVKATGDFVVLPVYLNTPSEDEIKYLAVGGCDTLCGYEDYRTLTANFVLDEDDWRTECAFTTDYDFDTSSID